jgi:hypothetical protein
VAKKSRQKKIQHKIERLTHENNIQNKEKEKQAQPFHHVARPAWVQALLNKILQEKKTECYFNVSKSK